MGKRADLIVVNQNILEIPKHGFLKTKVLLTMLDGEPVYGSSNWEKIVERQEPIMYNAYQHNNPYGREDEQFLPGTWRVNQAPE